MAQPREYFPFNPAAGKPLRLAPTGAVDSQFHILGPRGKYRVRPDASYEMPTAVPGALRRMHEALGIERGIVVQTTTYGEDHAVVLDALAELGPGYKACANALVFESADDAYLQRLHEAGVRGARFAFRLGPGAGLARSTFDRAVGKIRDLGWYMKVQPGQFGIVDRVSWFEHIDIPILIDHMGRPDASLGPDRDPNIAKLRELLDRGNFWVMLSLGEKLSKTGPPWDDVLPLARAMIDANPERCVWGSDWPHLGSTMAPPGDALLLDLMHRFVRDEAELRLIMVDNPSKLFGYAQV